MNPRRRSATGRLARLLAFTSLLLLIGGGAAFAAPGWQAPVDLVPPDEWNKGPVVAMNERGDVAIVWWQDVDPYNSRIRGMVRPAGGEFSAAHEISDPAGTFPTGNPYVTTGQNDQPQVAVGPTGDAVAVWERGNGIRFMTFAPGAPTGPRGWAHEFGPQDLGAHRMELGMDGDGNATVFWSNDHVHYVERPRGGTFGARRTIPNPGTAMSDPGFAVSAGGGAAVAWADYENVFATARDAGGAFGPPQTLGRGGSADVAMDAAGNAVAVWIEPQLVYPPRAVMRMSHRPARGRFGASQVVATITYGWPKVAMSRAGETIFYWGGGTHGIPDPARITALGRSKTGALGNSEPVARDYNGLPRLALDSAGNAYMAWQATWGDEVIGPYAAVRPAGGAFSGQTHRLAPGVSWGPTAIAAGASGKAVAVWPVNIGGEIGLQLAEYGEAATKPALVPGTAKTAGARPTRSAPSRTAMHSLLLDRTQRGPVVRGSIRVRASRCTLAVTLRRAGKSLGRSTKKGLAPGHVKFAVRLRRGARASLRKKGALSLSVRVRVACETAATATATRRVKLRRS